MRATAGELRAAAAEAVAPRPGPRLPCRAGRRPATAGPPRAGRSEQTRSGGQPLAALERRERPEAPRLSRRRTRSGRRARSAARRGRAARVSPNRLRRRRAGTSVSNPSCQPSPAASGRRCRPRPPARRLRRTSAPACRSQPRRIAAARRTASPVPDRRPRSARGQSDVGRDVVAQAVVVQEQQQRRLPAPQTRVGSRSCRRAGGS